MSDSPPQSTLSALNPLPLFLHKHANFRKLATKEDPYHIHKTLGILSILSFIYRYGVVYPETGTLGFDGSWFDWATMLVHNCLAFSSIQFRVPAKRIDSKPMVIYEEYRQHAMVFTNRCFAVFMVAYFWGGSPPVWAAPLAVAVHHLMADDITRRHGSGNTAVRSVSKKLKTSSFYKRVGYLYSFYQYLAIASHIVPHDRLADAGYNTIIAIASSAFMMTLYRKKIIRGRTHMVVYSFCLLLSAYHIVRMTGIWVAVLTALAFAVRVNFRWANKYAIWTVFRFIVAAIPVLPLVAGA